MFVVNQKVYGQRLANKGDLFGEGFIRKKLEFKDDLVSNGDSICLELSWERIREILKLDKNAVEILKRLVFLVKVPLFKGLSYSQLAKLASKLETKTFADRNIIFEEGQPINSIFILKKGTVKVFSKGKLVRIVYPNTLFGEIALRESLNEYQTANVEESATVFLIPTEAIIRVLSKPIVNYMLRMWDMENKASSLESVRASVGKNNIVCSDGENVYRAVITNKKESLLEIKLSEERKRIKELRSPFITRHLRIIELEETIITLKEYCGDYSLEQFILGSPFIDSDVFKTIIASLMVGVDFVHSSNEIVGLLSPSNVLFSPTGILKINEVKGGLKTILSPESYLFLSPENIRGVSYSKSGDYWAVGVVGIFCLQKEFPFVQKDMMEVFNSILHLKPVIEPREGMEDCIAVLHSLLDKDSGNRLASLEELKEVALFSEFDWNQLFNLEFKRFYQGHSTEINEADMRNKINLS